MPAQLVARLCELGQQPAAARGLSAHNLPEGPFPDIPDSAPLLSGGLAGNRSQALDRHSPAWNPSLSSQLDSFQQWQTAPSSLARIGLPLGAQAARQQFVFITGFLGYCAYSLRLSVLITLAACLQPELVALYIRAKMQAGQGRETCQQVPQNLLKARSRCCCCCLAACLLSDLHTSGSSRAQLQQLTASSCLPAGGGLVQHSGPGRGGHAAPGPRARLADCHGHHLRQPDPAQEARHRLPHRRRQVDTGFSLSKSCGC